MSRQLINEYRADLDRLRTVSGSRREGVLSESFKDLLKRWGRTHDLTFTAQHEIITQRGNRIYPDGALLHALRVPFGYWEAKDADDDLDAEIAAKTRKGYPRDNIIYSDDHTAVLIQAGHEVARVAMDDTDRLFGLLTRFFAHERQEVADFKKAVKQFAQDLPAVLEALRNIIRDKRNRSKEFGNAEQAFLDHAQKAINPAVSRDDVQEMLIQHILTEDIFAKVFDNPDFHRQNNVASELYKLEDKLFGRGEKSQLLRALAPYYSGIAKTAAVISTHSEKQGFLKGLYENFYKVYNPKAADRLGVVYTPGEIVRFMIRSADWLCEKHFGKNLIDRGVEILDPATGTGTFIVELLESFRGHGDKLRHKYKEELHANEIAILPYYVANLNIEATYQAITGQFAEFENLCLVDTLDNVDALGIHSGHQFDLLGSLSDANIERIKRQNRRKISVIIGNPPYNANQQNENDNNKNRTYAHIDARIKNTYIKASTAQKTKLYDMYARFYRWASDRIGDEGVLAFVTNRSFIESRTFDGFRKLIAKEFKQIWIVDLGGDVRANPKLSGTKHNVFGIQTGVAIAVCVRMKGNDSGVIRYVRRPEDETAEDKLGWLNGAAIQNLEFERIKSGPDGEWLNQSLDDFLSFIPIASKEAKGAANPMSARAIAFQFVSGIKTNRDEWVYDFDHSTQAEKVHYFSEVFNNHTRKNGITVPPFDLSIKWSRDLKKKRQIIKSDIVPIISVQFRPFVTKKFAASFIMNDILTSLHQSYFGEDLKSPNIVIPFLCRYSDNPLSALAVNRPFDYCFLKMGNGGTESIARYRYTKSGERLDNITDWAFNKFVAHYGKQGMNKDVIFAYCYAVLHDPVYRETYAMNLKREFPRIPFYPDFNLWAAWGEGLLAMHIGYEALEPWPVVRIETPAKRAEGTHPKPILKSQAELGLVVIDADTQITGIPTGAWAYRLGNRSAIDWVLDQHKEKKPRDPTIAAIFNTYRFADHKESMIDLLAKVVRVSVDTVAITKAMEALDRTSWE